MGGDSKRPSDSRGGYKRASDKRGIQLFNNNQQLTLYCYISRLLTMWTGDITDIINKMKNTQTYRIYKGIKIEHIDYGPKREYQTTFANIGRYSTLKTICHMINMQLKKKYN